jgi:hypothetical protein
MVDRVPVSSSYMMQHAQTTGQYIQQQHHYDMSLPSTSNQLPPNGMQQQPTPPYYPRFPSTHNQRVQHRQIAPQFISQSSSIYVFTSEMANE